MAEFVNACAEQEDLSGQFRHTAHIKPIAYNDGGIFRRIVGDWADSGVSERPHIITRAPLMVSVGSDGMRRIHPTREIDRYAEFGAPYIKIGGVWTKVDLGQPSRSANLLSWTTVQANVYVAHAGYFVKMGILLKNGWRPPGGQFAFPVGLNGLTRDGDLILRDGIPMMHVQAPHVEDLDNPEDIRPVASQFVQVSGQWYVLFTLPSLVGMSRPLVDPTLTLQPAAAAGKDTRLVSTLGTRNYGVATAIIAYGGEKGLVEFDISEIPADAICTSATVYFYQSGSSTANAFTITAYSIAVGNAAWPEGTKNGVDGVAGDSCWNYLDQTPGTETAWAGSAGLSTSGTDYEVSAIGSFSGNRSDANGTEYACALTAARVQGWFGAVNTNYGVILTASANLGGLASSDHATAGYRPKLVVDYSLMPRHPAAYNELMVY